MKKVSKLLYPIIINVLWCFGWTSHSHALIIEDEPLISRQKNSHSGYEELEDNSCIKFAEKEVEELTKLFKNFESRSNEKQKMLIIKNWQRVKNLSIDFGASDFWGIEIPCETRKKLEKIRKIYAEKEDLLPSVGCCSLI